MTDVTYAAMKKFAYETAIAETVLKETVGTVRLATERWFDIDDEAYMAAIANRGLRDFPQIVYWDLQHDEVFRHIKYTYNETLCQISMIRYRKEDDKWLGYQKVDNRVIELDEDWVYNFPEHVRVRAMEESEKGSNKFIRLPLGDVIEVFPTMDVSKNPLVRYQQGYLDTCAFSSLASALFQLDFVEEARTLHDFGVLWTSTNKENFEKTLEVLMKFIEKSPKFSLFRRTYCVKKIRRMYNIFTKVPISDIRLIVFTMSDNTETHAVTVVEDYVFDANCPNALPLTKEGLDCCCGVNTNFFGVARGYHWTRRKQYT